MNPLHSGVHVPCVETLSINHAPKIVSHRLKAARIEISVHFVLVSLYLSLTMFCKEKKINHCSMVTDVENGFSNPTIKMPKILVNEIVLKYFHIHLLRFGG